MKDAINHAGRSLNGFQEPLWGGYRRPSPPNCRKGAHAPPPKDIDARQAVYPCHRHHVAGGQVLEHLQQLFPVGACAGHLFPVNPRAPGLPQLLKLGIEG